MDPVTALLTAASAVPPETARPAPRESRTKSRATAGSSPRSTSSRPDDARLAKNMREQRRSNQISQQIDGLRQILTEADVPVEASKSSILCGTAHYIRALQDKCAQLEADSRRLEEAAARVHAEASGDAPPVAEGYCVWHGPDCGHDTERCDVVREIVAQEKARDAADSQTRDVSPDASDPRGSSPESDAARGTSPDSDVRAAQSGNSSDDLASAGRRDVSPDSDSSSDSGNASPGDSASSGTLTRPPPTKRARHEEPGDRRRYENTSETQSFAPATRSR
mmetsp:Transcript_11235/g.33525  ORF Transcript_11235/g.33525 Transcript_11235/m.33525 type:complete len:280 (-) Transcript_11235:79-918(-)